MPNAIPILDLPRQYADIQVALERDVLAVLASGAYILGPRVEQFENEAATYLSCKHAIGVASGSDALYLALRALNIGPGDEVITTPFSYVATSEAISRTGAKPVFVDIDAETFNMDLGLVKQAITPNTKALLPVHLYGQAMDMDALMTIAKAHSLAVVEDCAQAIGATWNGRPVGSFGDFGCFSFFPTKNLGAAGDGGLVTTNNADYDERVRRLRVHGAKTRYYHETEGINSRLDALQAAILSVKLPHLAKWNAGRQAIAQRYTEAFKAVEGITPPSIQPNASHVFHQYTVRLGNRDAIQARLQELGVQAMIYYPLPLHLQGIHADLGHQAGDFPVTEQVAEEVLSLPIFPELREDEVTRVIETLTQVVSELTPSCSIA